MNNKIPLSNFTLNITDGKHGDCLNEENSGYYFLSVKDIKQYDIDYKNARQITEADFIETHKRTRLEKGDILLANSGNTIGKMVYVQDSQYLEKSTFQKSIAIIKPDSSKINGRYLFYNLLANVEGLRRAAVGSAQPNLLLMDLRNFQVSVKKELSDQERISKVLSDLDEKIALNNKINTELETMAKLIYDYWFVQFDFPDSNGKPYKSSGGKMVYNKALKREIPKGWEGDIIGNILRSDLGGTPSTKVKEYWGGDIPWLNSGEIANFPIIEAEEHITSDAIEKSATSLMPKGTCVLSITRHLRPSILAVEACANQSVVGIYESEKLKASFLYPYLKNEIPRLMSLRTGAQQPHINKGIVDASPIVVPPNEPLNIYYEKVKGIYEQINNNAFQNKELVELRNWLLPMLMNGQVTVKTHNVNKKRR